MELFDSHRPETRIVDGLSKYSPTKYEHREPGALNPQEFKDTIAGVLGTRRYDDQLDKLFTKVSLTTYITLILCKMNSILLAVEHRVCHYREIGNLRTQHGYYLSQQKMFEGHKHL